MSKVKASKKVQKVGIAGTVANVKKGTKVSVQRLAGTTWVAGGGTDGSGAYSTTVSVPAKRGTFTYRVVVSTSALRPPPPLRR